MVNRKELVTDVTYDRSKVVEIIAENSEEIRKAVAEAKQKKAYLKKLKAYEEKLRIFEAEGIEYEMAESAPGRGNIWARLEGSLCE